MPTVAAKATNCMHSKSLRPLHLRKRHVFYRKKTIVFRFTGKERDSETGLYNFGARMLDPRTSRWLSVDPAMYQGDFIPRPGHGAQGLPNGG